MTKKIFRSIISVAMVVLLSSLFIASSFLYDYFNKSQVSQLKEELSLIATNVAEAGQRISTIMIPQCFALPWCPLTAR